MEKYNVFPDYMVTKNTSQKNEDKWKNKSLSKNKITKTKN
jgi:hypothetical protein